MEFTFQFLAGIVLIIITKHNHVNNGAGKQNGLSAPCLIHEFFVWKSKTFLQKGAERYAVGKQLQWILKINKFHTVGQRHVSLAWHMISLNSLS